jgi:hypothetical protein
VEGINYNTSVLLEINDHNRLISEVIRPPRNRNDLGGAEAASHFRDSRQFGKSSSVIGNDPRHAFHAMGAG